MLLWFICEAAICAVTQINLTTQVLGILPVLNGGTGVSTSTGTGSTVLSNAPTFSGGTVNINGMTVSSTGATLAGPASGTFAFNTANNVQIASTAATGLLRATSGWCISTGACTPTSGIFLDMQGSGRFAGHVFYHSTTPTIGGTGCTAGTGSVDQRGSITLGIGATSCTVTFGSVFIKPMPMVSASTLLITPVISSVSTTILTIGVSSATGTVYYHVDDVD